MGKKENEFSPDDTVGTPEYIVEAIVRVLGPIGLDPCSHPLSIVSSKTAVLLPAYAPTRPVNAVNVFYGDGLATDWSGHGLVYVNPPYSDLAPWFDRAARCGDEVLMLVPARTGNVFWPKAAGRADLEVRLGRVTHRGEKTHAPFHQWLLYYGARVETAMGLGMLGDVRVHPRHTRFAGDPVERWRAR